MLKRLRRLLAILSWLLITLTLLGIVRVAFLGRVQLVPALLAMNVGVLVFWGLLTLVFGRLYCSVVCPMGILQDIIDWLSRRIHMKRNRYSHPLLGHLSRPLFLIIGIWGFVESIHWLPAMLDPWSQYGRMVHQGLYPLWLSFQGFLSSHNAVLGTWFVREEFFTQSLLAAGVGGGLFLFLLITSWLWGRTFCGTLCPVGWALGWLSRWSLWGVVVDEHRCVHCGRCESRCKASCLRSADSHIDHSRCLTCFDCIEACPEGAIRYGFRWGRSVVEKQTDPSRRSFLATTASLLALPLVSKAQEIIEQGYLPDGSRYYTERLDADTERRVKVFSPDGHLIVERYTPIMPPATTSRARYLDHCVSCHLCVAQCPHHVLRPSTTEFGSSAILVPTVSYERGYCHPDCNVCAEVCPTDAIQLLPLSKKRVDKMGVAVFDSRTCVTATDDVDCDACVRHCPHKAITMVVRGNHKVPKVSVNRCTGCGACEFYCPARPKAIHVEGLLS